MSRVTLCAVGIVAPGERLAPAYYAAWPVQGAGRRHAVHRGVALNAEGSAGQTLDTLVQEQGLARLDLIKIDIDGGELAALRGASATLERWRPALVLELSAYALNEHGGSLDALLALLADARYRLLEEATFAPLPGDRAADVPECGRSSSRHPARPSARTAAPGARAPTSRSAAIVRQSAGR